MKLKLILLALSTSLWMNAQNQPNDSELTSKVQKTLDEYYTIISGPIGQKRDFNKFKELFHKDARLTYSYYDTNNQLHILTMSVDQFISQLGYLEEVGFREWELSNTINNFSSISQAFSVYEFKSDNGKISGRGITGYELIYNKGKYQILSMNWTMETKSNKIPDKYLKSAD